MAGQPELSLDPAPPVRPISSFCLPETCFKSDEGACTDHTDEGRLSGAVEVVLNETEDEGGFGESRGAGKPSWNDEKVIIMKSLERGASINIESVDKK
jgi:hypothetical protein